MWFVRQGKLLTLILSIIGAKAVVDALSNLWRCYQ